MCVVIVGELDFVYVVVEVDDVVVWYGLLYVMYQMLWGDWEVIFFGVVVEMGEDFLLQVDYVFIGGQVFFQLVGQCVD